MSHSILFSAVVVILGIIAGAIAVIAALVILGCVILLIGKTLSAVAAGFRAKPAREIPAA
ncbi:MAG: hypothetical protein ACYDC3_11340 [Candidatus Binataceae bacterium]